MAPPTPKRRTVGAAHRGRVAAHAGKWGMTAAALALVSACTSAPSADPEPGSRPSIPSADPEPGSRPSIPSADPEPGSRPSIPRNDDGAFANPFRIGRPLVIAHAGGDGLFPGNTLLAYERSVELGNEVIDVDVQVSADGVPLAFHDPIVDLITNSTGRVSEMTAAQVTALDAGYHFAPDDGFPFRGKGVPVATVAEILDRFPTMLTTLDMKDQRIAAVAPVCELVRAAGRGPRLYVGVDTDEQVIEFRRLCPEVHTSGTSEERARSRAAREAGDTSFRSEQLVGQPGYLGDDGRPRITAETLEYSHRSGTAILTWVIDDPATMGRLIDIGIDGIYTRRPDVLVSMLAERGLLD